MTDPNDLLAEAARLEVESPDYSLGDKEPCTTCGEGVAHVMTLVEAAAYEASIARGEREPERAYT